MPLVGADCHCPIHVQVVEKIMLCTEGAATLFENAIKVEFAPGVLVGGNPPTRGLPSSGREGVISDIGECLSDFGGVMRISENAEAGENNE